MTKSQIIVAVLVTTFLISGITEAVWPSLTGAAFLIHIVVIACLLFWWVGEHASEQGLVERPFGARVLAALIPLIGLPYYFYRSYGFQSGTIKLLLAIVLLVVSAALYMVPFYVVDQFKT